MRIRLSIIALAVCLAGACAGAPELAPTAAPGPPSQPVTTSVPAQPPPAASTSGTIAAPTTTRPTPTAPDTATVPPGTEPPTPLLVVTWPEPNAVVDSRIIPFAGMARPGATVVAAGNYDVAVDASGQWSISLVLNPGGNVVRFVAADDAGNSAEVRVPVFYEPPIVLRHDGLGVVTFGQSVDTVMPALTELLGPPDWEEVQISVDDDYTAQWDLAGLYVQFTDWSYFDGAGEAPHPIDAGPVLHQYWSTAGVLATDRGIGVGSTVAELEQEFPDVAYWASYCDEPTPNFTIDDASGWLGYRLFGYLDGDPSDPGSRVSGISAGIDRTPC